MLSALTKEIVNVAHKILCNSANFCILFVHNYDFTAVEAFRIDKILRKCYTYSRNSLEIIISRYVSKA